jgi:molybdopterin-guanine dinucleotide biosynthesis protein A
MINPTMTNTPPIHGLILAGGRSSRMGRDKSLIPFHGKPQREYLAELLANYCDNVFLSRKKNDGVFPTFKTIPDNYPTDSPLNGILSAFDVHPDVAWLTVPVDMPWVDSKTITSLISNRDIYKAATCFLDSDGKNPEPLLPLWEPSCYSS